MLKSFKYRIYPNKEQSVVLSKHFGACRWVYNDALALRVKLWEDGKQRISWVDLCARVTVQRKTSETAWLGEVSADSLNSQIRNLEGAFRKFFREKAGFPNFKSKRGRLSYQYPKPIKIDFERSKIKLPKMSEISFARSRRFEGTVRTTTVSRDPSGKHFVSVLVETGVDVPAVEPYEKVLGIDLGLAHFGTLSTGEKIENPSLLKTSLRKLATEQRRMSRKQKGSKNRNKQRIRVALAHEKVANQRKDFLHKLSSKVTRENQAIAIEDLNVAGMVKNRKLSRAISDASWSEFVRQLEYKASWYGKTLLRCGRYDPTSKLCPCGVVNSALSLSVRIWTCSGCGIEHDRDILAANNIVKFAIGRVAPEFTPVESSRTKGTLRSRKIVAKITPTPAQISTKSAKREEVQ